MDLLEYIEIKTTEQEMYKFLSEIDPEQTGFIEANAFRNVMIEKEVARLCGTDETELLQAFVAMGGQPDGEGSIDAETLIHTIKNEFQMTIDIEKLIEEIDEDGSGEIEFDEFKALLQQDS